MTTPGRGDGLIRPLNAPSGQQMLPGVQPGVTGAVVTAQYVIIFGQATGQQSGGLFIYEGSPGPGNPPVYSDTNATEDPYGNAVAAGIWAGQFGSIQVGLQTDLAAGTADIFWVPSTAAAFAASAGIFQSGGQAILQIFGSETTDNPAANSDYVAFYLWDHGSATGPGASAAVQAWFFDSTTGAPHNFFSGNYEGLVIPAALLFGALAPLLFFWLLWRAARKRGEVLLARFAAAVLVFGVFHQILAMAMLWSPSMVRLTPLQPMRYLHIEYFLFFLMAGGLLGRFVLKQKVWRWAAFLVVVNGGMLFAQQAEFSSSQHLECRSANRATRGCRLLPGSG